MGTLWDANEERIREQEIGMLLFIFTPASANVYRAVVQITSTRAEERRYSYDAELGSIQGLDIKLQASEAPTHPDLL
ncbi:hypothetical protein HYFRA_00002162 [Hymenoscyphus fraxineus]|uniref:Uncharacterized protein n=1 Tax=Hymenoscyphus fraxineus TaxID=746836 RepID=A0A9N9KJZ1_9HELO|nr:hypothetical protein HYFRA_00002162 [Hymenoscyphus fraxineus]